MAPHNSKKLLKRALRIDQDKERSLYLFSLKGHELLAIADISRVSRDDTGKLIGYQRPEVKKHVMDIANYLNGEMVLFPNSIILALSSLVKFRSSRGPQVKDGDATAGTIEIPYPITAAARKPAWIVDGQQRALAISKASRQDIPVPISAFVTDEVELQRDQFLRVNNTKPLPRGLITELLPEVSFPLPANMAVRKIPAALCNWLNDDPPSPFFGLIRRASTPKGFQSKTVVADSSIAKMVEESLVQPSGCLFPFRNVATGETDLNGIAIILMTYWSAVKNVFPEAWGASPTKSRLMHGVGILAMGRLMNKIMGSFNPSVGDGIKYVEQELGLISKHCRWTSGIWEDLGGLPWNELQNVHRHISLLSNYLIRKYIESKGLLS